MFSVGAAAGTVFVAELRTPDMMPVELRGSAHAEVWLWLLTNPQDPAYQTSSRIPGSEFDPRLVSA